MILLKLESGTLESDYMLQRYHGLLARHLQVSSLNWFLYPPSLVCVKTKISFSYIAHFLVLES